MDQELEIAEVPCRDPRMVRFVLPYRDLGMYRHVGWILIAGGLLVLRLLFRTEPLMLREVSEAMDSPIMAWLAFMLIFMSSVIGTLIMLTIGIAIVCNRTRSILVVGPKHWKCCEVAGLLRFSQRFQSNQLSGVAIHDIDNALKRKGPGTNRNLICEFITPLLRPRLRLSMVAKRKDRRSMELAFGYPETTLRDLHLAIARHCRTEGEPLASILAPLEIETIAATQAALPVASFQDSLAQASSSVSKIRMTTSPNKVEIIAPPLKNLANILAAIFFLPAGVCIAAGPASIFLYGPWSLVMIIPLLMATAIFAAFFVASAYHWSMYATQYRIELRPSLAVFTIIRPWRTTQVELKPSDIVWILCEGPPNRYYAEWGLTLRGPDELKLRLLVGQEVTDLEHVGNLLRSYCRHGYLP
jgi:hypothetical protein